MSKARKLVGILKSQMALEQCDPAVMPYFTDYYWIPADKIDILAKALEQAGYKSPAKANKDEADAYNKGFDDAEANYIGYLPVEEAKLEVLSDEEIKEKLGEIHCTKEGLTFAGARQPLFRGKAISQATITAIEKKGKLYRIKGMP